MLKCCLSLSETGLVRIKIELLGDIKLNFRIHLINTRFQSMPINTNQNSAIGIDGNDQH